MVALQSFTLGGSGGHAPPGIFSNLRSSEVHSEEYRETHKASREDDHHRNPHHFLSLWKLETISIGQRLYRAHAQQMHTQPTGHVIVSIIRDLKATAQSALGSQPSSKLRPNQYIAQITFSIAHGECRLEAIHDTGVGGCGLKEQRTVTQPTVSTVSKCRINYM